MEIAMIFLQKVTKETKSGNGLWFFVFYVCFCQNVLPLHVERGVQRLA